MSLDLNNMKISNFIGGPTDNLSNIYGSSIAERLIDNRDCAVNFRVDLFSILSKSHSLFYLKVLETIHILSGRLSLCKQKECLLRFNIISIWSPIQFFSPIINISFFFFLFFFLLFYMIFSLI